MRSHQKEKLFHLDCYFQSSLNDLIKDCQVPLCVGFSHKNSPAKYKMNELRKNLNLIFYIFPLRMSFVHA